MKQIILLSLIFAGVSFAALEKWTNKEGKTAELELVRVFDKDGEQAGEFKMRAGKTVTLQASDLSEESAGRLAAWEPPAPVVEDQSSVFDEVLEGNLLKLQGKSLKSFKDFTPPEKYYLFYYTASWCGPCHKFTPSLVKFYDNYKPGNNDFDIVLITSDSDEDSMEKYAFEMKMQWPQLKLSKAGKFQKEFKHPGTGIPNLVLTDVQGNLIKTSYVGEEYVGPAVVMNHLETLLKK